MYDKNYDYIFKSKTIKFRPYEKNNLKITKYIIKNDRNIVNSVSV